MADLSIIEFVVYGLVTYSSLLMLIISVIKEIPDTKSKSILRSIYLIPGIICAFLLMQAGPDITLQSVDIITNFNSTNVNFTEYDAYETTTTVITLVNPVWAMVHFFFFIILTVHVIIQIVTLFTKTD